MWVLNRGWWWTQVILLAPGVVALVIGILDRGARTSDDVMTLWMFGIVWIFLQLMILGAIFFFMNRQKQRAEYFRENGIPGTATILAAATTGTTVNDMPQIELKLEITASDRDRYTITDKRCWNPLSLAGLEKGAELMVLIDPHHPKKIMFLDDERT